MEDRTREKIRELREQGLTVRQIALALGISTQAVYKHLKRIQTKPPAAETAL